MEETTATQPKTGEKPLKIKPKEIEFSKKFVTNNENGAKTVKEVYGIKDDNYARLKAHRLITKDNVRQAIEVEKETLKSALEKQGVTPQKIARKIDVLLDSDDPSAVDKGLKHATNIYGIEDPSDKSKTNNTYNFLFSAETQAQIKAIEEKIKEQLVKPHVQ